MPPNPGLLAPLTGVGEVSRSLLCDFGDDVANAANPLGVQESESGFVSVGVEFCANLEGVVDTVAILVGEGVGVDCLRGEGDAGLSGLRKGDARGEP